MKRFQELSLQFRSLIVHPIDYLTLTGMEFSLGYAVIAEKNRELDEDDFLDIAETCSLVYEKVRDANRRKHKIAVSVHNITAAGILIQISDEAVIKKMLVQDGILLDIQFRSGEKLRVSGTSAYIIEVEPAMYYVGIDFSASRYGKSIQPKLDTYIAQMVSER